MALYHHPDPGRREKVSLEALAEGEALGDPTMLSAALIARRVALAGPTAPMAERLAAGAEAVVQGDVEGLLL